VRGYGLWAVSRHHGAVCSSEAVASLLLFPGLRTQKIGLLSQRVPGAQRRCSWSVLDRSLPKNRAPEREVSRSPMEGTQCGVWDGWPEPQVVKPIEASAASQSMRYTRGGQLECVPHVADQGTARLLNSTLPRLPRERPIRKRFILVSDERSLI